MHSLQCATVSIVTANSQEGTELKCSSIDQTTRTFPITFNSVEDTNQLWGGDGIDVFYPSGTTVDYFPITAHHKVRRSLDRNPFQARTDTVSVY